MGNVLATESDDICFCRVLTRFQSDKGFRSLTPFLIRNSHDGALQDGRAWAAARGATAVLVPLRGVSAIDAEGQPFWWPEADAALFQSLRNWMSPQVKLIELELHINDPAFAEAAAHTLRAMLEQKA